MTPDYIIIRIITPSRLVIFALVTPNQDFSSFTPFFFNHSVTNPLNVVTNESFNIIKFYGQYVSYEQYAR